MTTILNAWGQPIGEPVPGWVPPPHPSRQPVQGRYCRLEALEPQRHVAALHAMYAEDGAGKNWTYLPYGPFDSLESHRAWLESASRGDDPLFFTIVRLSDGAPVGLASYLRIAPASGAVEVGHIHFSEQLKRSPVATEAMFLMMKRAFELGYRRYEWKCDALNEASRGAARRLGFSYEGTFRQATVYKGRNRDTAWYSIVDREWPALSQVFGQWLAPDNFDEGGRQRSRLSDMTKDLRDGASGGR